MRVLICSWTWVSHLMLSRLTTCWAQSFTRPNSTSTARRVTGPLMSAFQEISVVGLPNAQSHVAVEVFKGNFWVIVMSSRRQRRCGCSRHGAQLSASTCRRRSWLYGVALSDGTHAVPPLCFLLYVLYFLIMRRGGGAVARAHWIVYSKEALWKGFTSLWIVYFFLAVLDEHQICAWSWLILLTEEWLKSALQHQFAAFQVGRFHSAGLSHLN